jgi:hypothetical protein
MLVNAALTGVPSAYLLSSSLLVTTLAATLAAILVAAWLHARRPRRT